MKNIELIDKAIDKFNGVWPKAEFDDVDTDKCQEAILIALKTPQDDRIAVPGEIYCGSTGCNRHYFEVICTESEFLARKAERQNKPDWSELPAETQWLGQDRDGKWKPMVGPKPVDEGSYWVTHHHLTPQPRGEVIGRWQDTLEKRPAVTEAPEFKFGAEVFNLVDDNGWHARGELPPVGAKFEVYFPNDSTPAWNAGAVAYKSKEHVILKFDDGEENYYDASSLKKIAKFRPLRTEREKFIEAAMRVGELRARDGAKEVYSRLFDAGFRQPDQK